MLEEDIVRMSGKELRRLHVLKKVLEGRLLQREAAAHLGLTDRQIRRLKRRLLGEGEKGLTHRLRGRPSNRRKSEKFKERVLRFYQERYAGFGPTLAAEKLLEREGMDLSDETLRLWLKEAAIAYPSRRKRPHRRWRERRAHRGEMVQMDGSHHDWLEGRGPACVLMGYIDDASNEVYARFYPYEGTYPAMDSFWRYTERYGVPLSIYFDKHSTYKSTGKPTVEEELLGQGPMSQFERALHELGVEVIHADSPQAKGRIERLFRSLQDRLIKEMRLAGIATLEEANHFLEGYLPLFNQRFGVEPAQPGDLHRTRPSRADLQRTLCIKTPRVLRKDFTVAYEGRLYQIEENVRAKTVMVEQRLDGSLYLTHKKRALKHQQILSRPAKAEKPPEKPQRHPSRKSAADHPWNSFGYFRGKKRGEKKTQEQREKQELNSNHLKPDISELVGIGHS